jgi:N-acetylneuraminate synthase
MKDIFIVAEIGINHNGSIDIAEKLIRTAKKAGCDAVKFQKRTIEVVYSKKELDQDRESPWGKKFIDQKRGLEFGDKEYEIINNICKSLQIEWFASAWDIESLNFLKKFNNKYNKVASAMITHIPFLEEIAKQKKYTFVSTGMSDYKIIDKAIEVFKSYNCPFELMHSVSVYPCPENLLNLHLIKKLQERYNCKVGYSGHEASVSPSIYAVALGATSIERHITLDRSMYGSDQSASLEDSGLSQLVGIVRKFKILYGNSEKQILPEEINIIKKLRYWENK